MKNLCRLLAMLTGGLIALAPPAEAATCKGGKRADSAGRCKPAAAKKAKAKSGAKAKPARKARAAAAPEKGPLYVFIESGGCRILATESSVRRMQDIAVGGSVTWDGKCADGLISGNGVLRQEGVFIEGGRSKRFAYYYSGRAKNGIRTGPWTRESLERYDDSVTSWTSLAHVEFVDGVARTAPRPVPVGGANQHSMSFTTRVLDPEAKRALALAEVPQPAPAAAQTPPAVVPKAIAQPAVPVPPPVAAPVAPAPTSAPTPAPAAIAKATPSVTMMQAAPSQPPSKAPLPVAATSIDPAPAPSPAPAPAQPSPSPAVGQQAVTPSAAPVPPPAAAPVAPAPTPVPTPAPAAIAKTVLPTPTAQAAPLPAPPKPAVPVAAAAAPAPAPALAAAPQAPSPATTPKAVTSSAARVPPPAAAPVAPAPTPAPTPAPATIAKATPPTPTAQAAPLPAPPKPAPAAAPTGEPVKIATAKPESPPAAPPPTAKLMSTLPESMMKQAFGFGTGCYMDTLDGQLWENAVLAVRDRKSLRIDGWAVDDEERVLPDATYLRLEGSNGRRYYAATTTQERPDVAGHFGIPAFTRAGYRAVFTTEGLPPGEYEATVVMNSKGRNLLCGNGRRLKL